MVPETWEPTCTVVTASRVPVAPTTSTTSPRSTVPVVNWVASPRPRSRKKPAARAAGTRRSQR